MMVSKKKLFLRGLFGGGGSGLTKEQPENNIMRGAFYALGAALAGAQRGISLCQSLLRAQLGQRVNVMILDKALTLELAQHNHGHVPCRLHELFANRVHRRMVRSGRFAETTLTAERGQGGDDGGRGFP